MRKGCTGVDGAAMASSSLTRARLMSAALARTWLGLGQRPANFHYPMRVDSSWPMGLNLAADAT